jgi:hypothetical protein
MQQAICIPSSRHTNASSTAAKIAAGKGPTTGSSAVPSNLLQSKPQLAGKADAQVFKNFNARGYDAGKELQVTEATSAGDGCIERGLDNHQSNPNSSVRSAGPASQLQLSRVHLSNLESTQLAAYGPRDAQADKTGEKDSGNSNVSRDRNPADVGKADIHSSALPKHKDTAHSLQAAAVHGCAPHSSHEAVVCTAKDVLRTPSNSAAINNPLGKVIHSPKQSFGSAAAESSQKGVSKLTHKANKSGEGNAFSFQSGAMCSPHTSDKLQSSIESATAPEQVHPLDSFQQLGNKVLDQKGDLALDGLSLKNTAVKADDIAIHQQGQAPQSAESTTDVLEGSNVDAGALQLRTARVELQSNAANWRELILAAAQAQISADVAASKAAKQLEHLDLLATVAEEVQTQLAAVQHKQEETLGSENSDAESTRAEFLFMEWQEAVDKAKKRLHEAHASAATIREEALAKAQASTRVSEEAAIVSDSALLCSSAPLLLQPRKACETALAMHAEVIELIVGEQEAANATLGALSERAEAARGEAAEALTQAEIAAGHKSAFRKAGQASDAAAAESAARAFIHQSKKAHAAELKASGQVAAVQGMVLAAKRQLLSLRKAGEAVQQCLEQDDDPSKLLEGKDLHQQAVETAAEADLAATAVLVHQGCCTRLKSLLGQLQEQHAAATAKGDTYACDALQARMMSTQAALASAEESVKESQHTTEQKHIALTLRRQAELSQAEDAQAKSADLIQQASRLLEVICMCTEWLRAHAADAAMNVQCQLEHTTGQVSELQLQAVELESNASSMLARENLSGARAAQEEAARLRSDAQVV